MRLEIVFGKAFLVAPVVQSSLEVLLVSRNEVVSTFDDKYSELQRNLAPYVCVPWPTIFNYTSDFVSCWHYTKIMLAIAVLLTKGSNGVFPKRFLKNMLLIECAVQIMNDSTCLWYFIN